MVVLTTIGLFAWGFEDILMSPNLTSTVTIQPIKVNSKTDGLPAGVAPADIKMMFDTANILAITTCIADIWSRVTVNQAGNPFLTNVVTVRRRTLGF